LETGVVHNQSKVKYMETEVFEHRWEDMSNQISFKLSVSVLHVCFSYAKGYYQNDLLYQSFFYLEGYFKFI